LVIVDVTADDELQTAVDMINGAGISRNECLTQQDASEYSAALDCDRWSDSGDYVTCIDGTSEHQSRSTETGCHTANVPQQVRLTDSNDCHRLIDDGVITDVTTTSGGRQSSAMKLKCNIIEPQQQPSKHDESVSHDPVSPLSESKSPVIVSPAPGRRLPGTDSPLSESSASRSSAWTRRTLSNEPLGVEFDVKQITVRRPTNSSASPSGELDLFADMTPVITTSSLPAQSLLGILSAAEADAASTQPSSRLNMNDVNHLDSAVSCLKLLSVSV